IPALERELPDPETKVDATFGFGIHIMGIGGTGGVTVAATISKAAQLEGKYVIGLNQTGLAQKGGPVISDIKITNQPFEAANKIADGRTDLYLGFDILNATSKKNLDKCLPERTIAVVSTSQTPTGHMVSNRREVFPEIPPLLDGINAVTRAQDNVFLDGETLAMGLFGDSMATNLFMVGVAYQAGTIPLKAESIEAAIQESGRGVEQGVAAFRWGRMALVDRDFVEREIIKYSGATRSEAAVSAQVKSIVDSTGATGEARRLLEVRVADLIDYQNAEYARRYAEIVKKVIVAERAVDPGKSSLTEAAVRYLYKLMAYKDEYEVARLHTAPEFLSQLDALFPQGYSVKYNLAPPIISKHDPETGELKKKEFGSWMTNAFKVLTSLKRLRGGRFDPFGNTSERKRERQLIEEYIQVLNDVVSKLSPSNHAAAVDLASVPDEIRGFGHVKEKSIVEASALYQKRYEIFRNSQSISKQSTSPETV
ncbi:MAG: 2-oxoacid:acceptor oxidoreductase family protein, partial [Gammaproteobacteria bacterium]|nr:2-oxoacid:acceptor oxidoreductase family protein [Gammaproteobacteria bacterium]